MKQQSCSKLDKRVISIARNVRRRIERLAKKPAYSTSPKYLDCMCAIASYALYNELKKLGYKDVSFVEGQCKWLTNNDNANHCWVTLDGHIIDLTFTQFDTTARKVSVFKTSNVLFKQVRTNKKALNAIEKNWPPEQRPTALLQEYTAA